MTFNEHFEVFKQTVEDNVFSEFPKQKEYFYRLIDEALVHNSSLHGLHVIELCRLPVDEQSKRIQKFLEEPTRAINLEQAIVGIEDPLSVTFVENTSCSSVKMTYFEPFMVLERLPGNRFRYKQRAKLYVGDVELSGRMDIDSLGMRTNLSFCGVLNDRLFLQVNDEKSMKSIKDNIANRMLLYLNQLSFIEHQDTETPNIWVN